MTGRAPPRTATGRHGFVILLASVMPIMAIISLVPVLPLLMQEFAAVPGSEFLVPAALTVPALCVALFSPVAGWLSDRIGRRGLLVAALVLYSGFGVLPWFLTDLFHIIAARIAAGMVEAVIMTVATALIGDFFSGSAREKWITLQIAVGSISAVLLIAVAGGLGEALGSRGPFLLYLLALPVALAAWIVLFEPAHMHGAEAAGTGHFPFAAILPLALTTLLVAIVFYTVTVQLGPILQFSGPVSPGTIGLIGAAQNLAICLGTAIFRHFGRLSGPRMLVMGLVIAGVGYAGAGMSSALMPIAGFAILACVGSGIMLPNMLGWTMRSIPARFRGRGMGLWTGSFFLGQFLAPLIAGAAAGITGGLPAALIAYAALIALGALAAGYLAMRPARADHAAGQFKPLGGTE